MPLALAGVGLAAGAGLAFGELASGFVKDFGETKRRPVFRGPGADPLAGQARSFLSSRLQTPGAESPILSASLDVLGSRLRRLNKSQLRQLRDAGFDPEFIASQATELTRGRQETTALAFAEISRNLELLRTEGIFDFLRAEVADESDITRAELADKARRTQASIAQGQLFLGGLQAGGSIVGLGA